MVLIFCDGCFVFVTSLCYFAFCGQQVVGLKNKSNQRIREVRIIEMHLRYQHRPKEQVYGQNSLFLFFFLTGGQEQKLLIFMRHP